jgi:hypothetical protein
MIAAYGNQIHQGDANYGVTMYCGELTCSAPDVQGHGKNEKEAYEIVTEKFKRHTSK